jgi:hypothetical protein
VKSAVFGARRERLARVSRVLNRMVCVISTAWTLDRTVVSPCAVHRTAVHEMAVAVHAAFWLSFIMYRIILLFGFSSHLE